MTSRTSSSPPTGTSSSRPTSSAPACRSTCATAAVWEEDFEIEPLVEGGARIFRRLHTPGFEGWTISRYRQTGGRMPEGDPEQILEDMDLDGVDVQVMHPNLSLFGLYSDDHELSMAHARVYNDYVIERFTPVLRRGSRPPRRSRSPTSTTRSPRSSGSPPPGSGRSCCPATPPKPYYSRDFDPVWAAAQANGVHVFIHTQTGGVKVNDPASTTLKVVMESARAGQPADDREVGVEAHDHAVRLQHRWSRSRSSAS